MEKFGEYLKNLRLKKDISLREFAKKLGIQPSYLSDIEQGKRNAPSKEKQEQIIRELNLNEQETDKFYDLAKEGKETEIAEDVKDIITSNESLTVLCRKIRRENINVEDIIRQLNKREKK